MVHRLLNFAIDSLLKLGYILGSASGRCVSNVLWQKAISIQQSAISRVATLCRCSQPGIGIGFGPPKGHPWATQAPPKRHARAILGWNRL